MSQCVHAILLYPLCSQIVKQMIEYTVVSMANLKGYKHTMNFKLYCTLHTHQIMCAAEFNQKKFREEHQLFYLSITLITVRQVYAVSQFNIWVISHYTWCHGSSRIYIKGIHPCILCFPGPEMMNVYDNVIYAWNLFEICSVKFMNNAPKLQSSFW